MDVPCVALAVLLLAAPAHPQDDLRAQCWALATSEPKKVAGFVRSALEKADDPAVAGSLHACRGYAFEQAGQLNEAAADYETAVTLTERAKDDAALADVLALRGELHHYRGRFDAAIEDLQKAYAAAKNPRQQQYALNAIANLYADRRVGAYDRAIEYYRELLASHERSGNAAGIATAHYNIGATLDTKGDLEGALAQYRRALDLEQKRGDAGSVADVQRAAGVTLTKLGRYPEALAMIEAALAHFLADGDQEGIAQLRLARGSVLRHVGRTSEAIRDLDAARAHFLTSASNRFLEKTEEERANAFASAGDWRAAFEARGALMNVRLKMSEALREEHVSRLRVQFETEKKEQENRALLFVRRLQAAAIVAGAIAIAFLIYVARRMRTLAMTDELTKLPNRRSVFAFAEERLRSVRTHGGAFSMLALDIDHFKRINDAHGHAAGDVVLRRVAQTCRAVLKGSGTIGRTGGEEFLVVLPGSGAEKAASVAERLREAVERIDCSDIAPGLRITISVGVSEWRSQEDFMAVARRADDLLYRAKERGRNRVELAVA